MHHDSLITGEGQLYPRIVTQHVRGLSLVHLNSAKGFSLVLAKLIGLLVQLRLNVADPRKTGGGLLRDEETTPTIDDYRRMTPEQRARHDGGHARGQRLAPAQTDGHVAGHGLNPDAVELS